MTKRRRLVAGILLGLLLSGSVLAQPLNTQIAIAINNLVTGVTPFTAFRTAVSSYLNWGATQGVNGYGIRDNAGNIEAKNSGGAWTVLVGGGGNPINASYWTRVPEAALTNETALSTLATALIVNTTATGVPVAYAGTSCTNQFVRALSIAGAATCAAVDINLDTTGTLGVGRGGTGLVIGTSGGVLGFTGPTTIASSVALTASAIVLGGGAGATPTPLASLGTTTTVLHGNAAGAPTFGAVSLTADVSGILPSGNGGTGNAFFGLSGPAASVKTYTLPNASTTILTTNAAVTAAQGGTGHVTYAVGDLLQASAATTLSRLAAVATGNVLISGGVATVSSWGKVGLTTHVSGTLPVTNGGTGLASYTTGDLIMATGATSLASLADVAAGRFLRSGGVGVIPAWSTTIWTNAATTGDLLYASAANTYANLAAPAAGQVLGSNGVGVAPSWQTDLQGTRFGIDGNGSIVRMVMDANAGIARIFSFRTADVQRWAFRVDGAEGGADSGADWALRAYTDAGALIDQPMTVVRAAAGAITFNRPVSLTTLRLGANLTFSATAPTISAGFGAGASVTAGTAASFRVDTGAASMSGTVGLPTATTGWNCAVEDLTATLANAADVRTVQVSSTTTTAVFENQTVSTGAAVNWGANDILAVTCAAF